MKTMKGFKAFTYKGAHMVLTWIKTIIPRKIKGLRERERFINLN